MENKYKAKKINGKTKQVHRLVMEEHLGRKLKPQEVVHHIDGNKSDNKIDNLMLFPTKSAHSRFHFRKGDLTLLHGLNKKKLINGKLECCLCHKFKKPKEFETRKSAYLGIIGVCKECRNAPRRLQP